MFNKLYGKPVATVEEIHEEFDSAQERLLKECDDILNTLEIPTEGKVERKASNLEALGFINSKTVEDYKDFKESVKNVEEKIDFTTTQATEIRNLAFRYPFEKFITTDELDRICTKYDLLHAPVANYIKDVPEKNVLEMKNRKPLDVKDAVEAVYELFGFETNRFMNLLGKTDTKFTESEVIAICETYGGRPNTTIGHLKNGDTSFTFGILYSILNDFTKINYSDYNFTSMTTIDQSGLHVAAPKSHFNLKGLDKITKFGWGVKREVEVKDPVVFEYCQNDIVRIITKWGTEDDQSYLDDALQNPTLN